MAISLPRGVALETGLAAAPGVLGLEGLALTVSDMERSVRFYARALGFVKLSDTTIIGASLGALYDLPSPSVRVVRMRLGREVIELTEFRSPRGATAPPARGNDEWFQHIAIVVRDIWQVQDRVVQAGGTPISVAPQRLPRWNPAAGGIQAYYFRDPDGHPLELLQFPPDKGMARWHRPTERLLLGIDHTAITVRDTDRSLAFWRDLLGLRVVGRSENHGIEQELLNGVPGSRVRITTLASPAGPGVELLDYLAPMDGRPYPAEARPNDLLHWHTTVRVPDPSAVLAQMRAHGHDVISTGIAPVLSAHGMASGFLARDPDGHAVQVIGGRW